MKTPEEMPQQWNEGEDTSTQPARKQRKPLAIIVTMILAALITINAGFGFLRLLFSLRMLTDRNVMSYVTGFLTGQLCILILAAAVVFACIKRPPWGRVISMVFAMGLGIVWVVALLSPHPDPVFKAAPGAEEVGAYMGRALMVIGVAVYVWSMIFGARAKAYFARNK